MPNGSRRQTDPTVAQSKADGRPSPIVYVHDHDHGHEASGRIVRLEGHGRGRRDSLAWRHPRRHTTTATTTTTKLAWPWSDDLRALLLLCVLPPPAAGYPSFLTTQTLILAVTS